VTSAVCTLFEGDYHLGVGALANSLHRFGFSGIMHVGYRGKLPDWMVSRESGIDGLVRVSEGLMMRLHLLETDWHLTNYKPIFMKSVFRADSAIEALFYFDPDIVIKCEWPYYEQWVESGLALVEEIATRGMPYNHPIRRQWVAFAQQLNMEIRPTFSQYFNGGFVGLLRKCEHVLDDWATIIAHLAKQGMDLKGFMPYARPHPFCNMDQEALNIVAMAAEKHLSTMGPEGMDFIPGGFTMSHAVGSPKPWRKNFLLSALRGQKLSMADRLFWENVESPIQLFPSTVIRQKRAMMLLAAAIGRFYHQ